MTRTLTLASVLTLAPLARAQDMPLSEILIDGEGWKKVEGPGPMPATNGIAILSPDRTTIFRLETSPGRFIDARQTRAAEADPFAPYCQLRVKRGQKTIAVTGLAVDRDGRIYAATEIGVQVFDPTGRLCGVLTPAAKGRPEHLAFEGDHLTMWIGNTKFTRKLNTMGAK